MHLSKLNSWVVFRKLFFGGRGTLWMSALSGGGDVPTHTRNFEVEQVI